jgi:hypothetical protein
MRVVGAARECYEAKREEKEGRGEEDGPIDERFSFWGNRQFRFGLLLERGQRYV